MVSVHKEGVLFGPPRKTLTVSELTQIIRALLEGEELLRGVWVSGETSNVRLATSGHLYFSLKDEFSTIECVYFGFSAQGRKKPEEGVSLLVFGDVSVYEKRSQYQLRVYDFILKGEGVLAQKLEELKRRLYEEGLFAEENKVPIPAFPRVVGVVTSPEAAAWRDVIKVLARRAPYLRVILFPCQVQGAQAGPTIISALKRADSVREVDVILLVRGGGSLEDLWCFNDEALARTIFSLKKPIITGIGHEVDFTIADFVADRREPTPSAAAEVVAPAKTILLAELASWGQNLASILYRALDNRSHSLSSLGLEKLVREVFRRLNYKREELRSLSRRLVREPLLRLARTAEELSRQAGLLSPRRIVRRLEYFAQDLDELSASLLQNAEARLKMRRVNLVHAFEKLNLLDPRKVLKRGYAILWDSLTRRIIKSISDAKPGLEVKAEVADGFIYGVTRSVAKKSVSTTEPLFGDDSSTEG